ncbi:glucokinase [Pseudoalteromonas xiamenensis]|uniref:glucokinase n=1 Tax=Pseudoalteromonas xiamenensis TaxID=882626 RepID=UPI0027E4BDFF|nr:glucokinase [Pseudoalteromonas xiamenensis]WMN59787.1 glucokinase [Pseudoalteromonas xiamenensis]
MTQTTSPRTTNQSQTDFSPILVADIGGTNARFAVATDFDIQTNSFVIEHLSIYPSANFSAFEAAIARFLNELDIDRPTRACLAVAGPIKGPQVYLTNLGWQFNAEEVKAEFGFESFLVINDFAAFAFAAPYLDESQNLQIKSGQSQANSNIAVMGPGTGFGAACLARDINGSAVMSCEAGHISLAAVTELDKQLLKVLQANNQHVSIETVFSGPGIVRLYEAMCEVHGQEPEDLSAAEIAAKAPECKMCDATLNHFCDWIGSVAGDLALTFGALGGVYIGGGILPRMTERLLRSRFVDRFSEKGLMSQYTKQIPVTLVTQENIPFIGAAACLHGRGK